MALPKNLTSRSWLVFALMFLASLTLFFLSDRPPLREISPCEMVKKKLLNTIVQRYSGTETDPNFLEPIALAVVRKRAGESIEKRSQFECVMTLYRLWRHSIVAEKE